jgi:hypothetical protein
MPTAVSEVPVDVFILEDCPHDWLFPQCAAVVSLLFQTCQGGAMPCVRYVSVSGTGHEAFYWYILTVVINIVIRLYEKS